MNRGNIEPRQKEEGTRLRRAYGGQGMQNPALSMQRGTSNIEHRTSNESKEPSPHPDPLPSHAS